MKLISEQTLARVVQELDASLFDGYIKPKSKAITAIVQKGVLDPDMDWFESPRPTGKFFPSDGVLERPSQ